MKLVALVVGAFFALNANAKVEKDWTMLVFLNGHNNLDRYGYEDINEMEVAGSNDWLNVVVQWASSSQPNTKRLYIQKDTDKSRITSPIIETLPRVDMGSANEFINFVRWGMQNYPAKHYFVSIWDHGRGWHKSKISGGADDFQISDISSDDFTGHIITTEQLGAAMSEISISLGRKVDMYGSDACLMAMAEVSDLMVNTVSTFVGSQELEPGDGWPYDDFLLSWSQNRNATPNQVGQLLNQAYLKSYTGGSQGNSNVTLSTFDLSQSLELRNAVTLLANELKQFPIDQKAKITASAASSQWFYYRDYIDLVSFVEQLEKNGVISARSPASTAIRAAVGKYVAGNSTSTSYAKARGLSVWFPSSASNYSLYSARYQNLTFATQTSWGALLDHLF